MKEIVEVSGGKRNQDLIIGDSSGKGRLTLWEDEIGKVYHLTIL